MSCYHTYLSGKQSPELHNAIFHKQAIIFHEALHANHITCRRLTASIIYDKHMKFGAQPVVVVVRGMERTKGKRTQVVNVKSL